MKVFALAILLAECAAVENLRVTTFVKAGCGADSKKEDLIVQMDACVSFFSFLAKYTMVNGKLNMLLYAMTDNTCSSSLPKVAVNGAPLSECHADMGTPNQWAIYAKVPDAAYHTTQPYTDDKCTQKPTTWGRIEVRNTLVDDCFLSSPGVGTMVKCPDGNGVATTVSWNSYASAGGKCQGAVAVTPDKGSGSSSGCVPRPDMGAGMHATYSCYNVKVTVSSSATLGTTAVLSKAFAFIMLVIHPLQ